MASTNVKDYSETSAFQVFAAMCWEQHKARHPAANIDPNRFAEISTGRWKAMTQEQKNAFFYKFKEEEEEKSTSLKRKSSQDEKSTPKSKKSSTTDDNEETKEKDPMKPTPKKTAFSFFSSEIGPNFRKEHTNLSTSEATKELRGKWQNLTDVEMKTYKEMAYKDQIRFETEIQNYEAEIARNQEPSKKPKAKKSAFHFFSLEKGAELRKLKPNLKKDEVAKEVTDLWENLIDESKQKYNDMATKDQSRFDEEKKIYQLSTSKVVYQAVKDPNKPKKALSGYMFFNGEVSLQVRKDNPKFTMGEVSKEVGERWQKITDEDKQKYQEMSDKDKTRHEEEMKNYHAPPPVMVPVKAMKKEKDPNRPKHSLGSYMYFSSEMGPKLRKENPDKAMTEVSKLIGCLWKDMEEEKRKKYVELAEKDKKRYEHEMELYKEGKFIRTNKQEELTAHNPDTSGQAFDTENSP